MRFLLSKSDLELHSHGERTQVPATGLGYPLVDRIIIPASGPAPLRLMPVGGTLLTGPSGPPPRTTRARVLVPLDTKCRGLRPASRPRRSPDGARGPGPSPDGARGPRGAILAGAVAKISDVINDR